LAPHEETREKLRQRIVAAARDLLSETASIEFSMRALAAKAKVAHVTPYNIFGSKQAVLLAVLDADMAEFERVLLARQKSDPLTEIFEVVRLCIEFWFSEPAFYKTLYRELLDIKGAYQTLAMPLREGFWRRLARSMAAQGHLKDFVAERPLAMHLRRITLQTIAVWIARDLSQEEVEAELGYSISLALLGAAGPGSSARIQERLLSYQRILVKASERA